MRESTSSKLKQMFYDSDIYGQSVQIHLGKKKKHKTCLGSCFTLITAVIMSIALYTLLLDIIFKNNPTIIELEKIFSDDVDYYQSIESLKFGINFFDNNGVMLTTPELQEMINKSLRFTLQSEDNDIDNINVEKGYGILRNDQEQTDVEYFYPDLQGQQKQTLFQQMNKKSTNQWRLQLLIDESILEAGASFWNLSFFDSYFDLENYSQPVQTYQKDQYYTLGQQDRLHIQTHFQKKQIQTDQGWIVDQIDYNSLVQQEDTTVSYLPSNVPQLYEVEFILNRKLGIVKRSYLKLQGALVQLGGLLKAIVLFFFVLSYPLTKLSLQVELVNSVFQFEGESDSLKNNEAKIINSNSIEGSQQVHNKSPQSQQVPPKDMKQNSYFYKERDNNLSSFNKFRTNCPILKIPQQQYQTPFEQQLQLQKSHGQQQQQQQQQQQKQQQQQQKQQQETYQDQLNNNENISGLSHKQMTQSMNCQLNNQGNLQINNDNNQNMNNDSILFKNKNNNIINIMKLRKDSIFKVENLEQSFISMQKDLTNYQGNDDVDKLEIYKMNENQNHDTISVPMYTQSKKEYKKEGSMIQQSCNILLAQRQKGSDQTPSGGGDGGSNEEQHHQQRQRAQSSIQQLQSNQQQNLNNSYRSQFKCSQDQKTKLMKKLVRQNFARKKPNQPQSTPESPLKTVEFQQARSLVHGKKNEDFNSIFTKLFKTISHNYLLMRFMDKIKYLCLRRFPKQQQLKFSMNKIRERLDIIFIMKKIVEIDKLKMILFDQNQLKIFEYLPRPVIKFDPYSHEQMNKQNLAQQSSHYHERDKQGCANSMNDSPNNKDGMKMTNIHELWQHALMESDKPYFVKVQEAARAYEQLSKKDNQDIYDQRLLQFLDSNRKNYFEDILNPNSPSSSQTQKVKLQDLLLNDRINNDHYEVGLKENELDSIPEQYPSDKNILGPEININNKLNIYKNMQRNPIRIEDYSNECYKLQNECQLPQRMDQKPTSENRLQQCQDQYLNQFATISENITRSKDYQQQNITDSLQQFNQKIQNDISSSSYDIACEIEDFQVKNIAIGVEEFDHKHLKQNQYMNGINKFQSNTRQSDN